MKYLLLVLVCLSCATSSKKWEVSDVVLNPESVYYDQSSERIYVSNVNGEGNAKNKKGYITVLKKDGQIIDSKWLKNLDAPKGMRASRGVLWVSDIDSVHSVDMDTAKIIKTYKVKGAKFLNDIAIDGNTVYVSDTLTSKIHKIENGLVSTFVSGNKYLSPNGLLVSKGNLYVASWGLTKDWSTKVLGHFYKINIKTKKMQLITKKPLGNLDGLEMESQESFIISDWVAGKVYRVNLKGEVQLVLDGKKGLADIGYIPGSRTLLVPNMLNNRVYNINLK